MSNIRITETKKESGFYEAGIYRDEKLSAVVSRQMAGGKFCVYSHEPVRRFRVKRDALNAAISIAVGEDRQESIAAT